MTKYTIMTALVNAGCDLDKLPAEILQAIENACLGKLAPVENNNNSLDASAKLMGAITILSTCIYCESSARRVSDYVIKKDYARAQRELTSMAFFVSGDAKLTEAYTTAGEMIGYLAANK